MDISPEAYQQLCQWLYKTIGLNLGESKEYLVDLRMKPVMQKWGYETLDQLMKSLMGTQVNPELEQDTWNAMTTNETLFFRDAKPYEYLVDYLLPELMPLREHSKKLRIWSAACSTGQEPYSIAMTLDCFLPQLQSWDIRIDATDIDLMVIEKARSAVYSALEVQRGLPVDMLNKYFVRDLMDYRLDNRIARWVQFEQLNLIDSFVGRGPYDIIFCRNVLIYFDEQTKKSIISKFADVLTRDGFLVLGSTENILSLAEELTLADKAINAVYKKA